MSSTTQVAYVGRNNNIAIELQENDVTLSDLSGITRVALVLSGDSEEVVDSNVDAGIIDWSNDYILIKLGLSSVPVGRYTGKVETYDADNPQGIVWTDSMPVWVNS